MIGRPPLKILKGKKMNAMVPNNGLALLTTRTMGETAGLRRLAEETRVAIALLNYQVGQMPSPNLLLDLLPYQEARGSSQIENISPPMTSCTKVWRLANTRKPPRRSFATRPPCLPAWTS